jgi:hypothetical protein
MSTGSRQTFTLPDCSEGASGSTKRVRSLRNSNISLMTAPDTGIVFGTVAAALENCQQITISQEIAVLLFQFSMVIDKKRKVIVENTMRAIWFTCVGAIPTLMYLHKTSKAVLPWTKEHW